jgi:ACS family tartrate transporter-like MFS transporter
MTSGLRRKHLTTETANSSAGTVTERSVIAKITYRLIPFMFLMYIFNYLDRQNVSYAKLQMAPELGFSEAVYSFGAGVFFVGYFLFEIPSNLIMEKVGARRWMARIMISWGIISGCTMFAHSALSFYGLRFLLGLTEAGFFPGMILYLTYWFPARERARAVATFMTATPLAGVLGGLMSSGILTWMKGVGGLRAWQWMFLLEAVPSFLLGFVVLAYLTDRPEKAHWLTQEEKDVLSSRLSREETKRLSRHAMTWSQAMSNGTVIQLTAFYFLLQVAIYGFVFNLPSLIKAFNLTDFAASLISAIPYAVAACAMVVAGIVSDRSADRKRTVATACLIAAAGLGAASLVVDGGNAVAGVFLLTVAAVGLWSTLGPFWSLPTSFLSGSAAAAGIAFINSIGNLGGFIGPFFMGWLKDTTHKSMYSLIVASISMLFACVLAATVHHDRSLEHPDEG